MSRTHRLIVAFFSAGMMAGSAGVFASCAGLVNASKWLGIVSLGLAAPGYWLLLFGKDRSGR